MSDELVTIARLKIRPDKLDEFKRLSAKCSEIVRTKTLGLCSTIHTSTGDQTEGLVIERYRDSQALLDHHENLGDTMEAILQTCSGEGEVAERRARN